MFRFSRCEFEPLLIMRPLLRAVMIHLKEVHQIDQLPKVCPCDNPNSALINLSVSRVEPFQELHMFIELVIQNQLLEPRELQKSLLFFTQLIYVWV